MGLAGGVLRHARRRLSDARERRRRSAWEGPPKSLMAVTVLAFVVAPLVDEDRTAGPPTAQLSAGSSAPVTTTVIPGRPELKTRPAPEPRVVGVVTFNQFRRLSPAALRADALAITDLDAVDVIGWQEAYDTGPLLDSLRRRGWETRRFAGPAEELAVSWRAKRWELLSADRRLVAQGIGDDQGRYPFGDRYAVRVTLRDKQSGRYLSILNTHLPQAIEDLDRPGRWRPTYNSVRARRQLTRLAKLWLDAPGRWVVGTGDYNVDARAEARERPPGGPSRMFAGRAVSSYDVLGIGDLSPTHVSGRHIDYVHVGREALREGTVRFLDQRTVPGLNSDHRPLLVRLQLR